MRKITGDILKLAERGDFDVIVHGANCFTTFGGGLARQIRETYIQAYMTDCKTRKGDYNKLGNFTSVEVTSKVVPSVKFTIVNAYTQYSFSNGEDVFEYGAFELILKKLKRHFKGLRIAFPNIGSGLAGGNKDVITDLIERFSLVFEDTGGTVTLVEYQ